MTGADKLTIGDTNTVIFLMFAWTILLILAYLMYDTNRLFRFIGDIFIKINLIKRTKKDLLVFALIPFAIGIFFLIYRLMMF